MYLNNDMNIVIKLIHSNLQKSIAINKYIISFKYFKANKQLQHTSTHPISFVLETQHMEEIEERNWGCCDILSPCSHWPICCYNPLKSICIISNTKTARWRGCVVLVITGKSLKFFCVLPCRAGSF